MLHDMHDTTDDMSRDTSQPDKRRMPAWQKAGIACIVTLAMMYALDPYVDAPAIHVTVRLLTVVYVVLVFVVAFFALRGFHRLIRTSDTGPRGLWDRLRRLWRS